MARKGENIYKRKDGRWEGRYIKGYDSQENPITGYVYAKTYSEVKEKLIFLKANVKNEITVVSSALTVNEWVKRWIEKKGLIKDSSKMIYKSYLKNHIRPAIGNVKLKKLSKDMLQIFINNMSAHLDAQTVRAVFSMLKLSLTEAKDKNLITPVYIDLALPKSKIKDVPVLDKPQQKSLEQVIAITI